MMTVIKRFALVLGLVVLSCGIQMRAQDRPLVVEGGTLIDGNGGAPLKDAVVVIEGNRFKAVGVKGKVAIPPNAKVIDATGKFILPGLIDAEAQGNWEIQPPQWLYFGFTTVYFGGTPYIRAEKALQEKGQLAGPRMYLSAPIIQAPFELLREDFRTPGSSDFAKRWPEGWSVSTADEARAAVEKRASEGKFYSLHVQEGWTPELLRAL